MTNEEVVQALSHLIGTPYDASIPDTIKALTGRTRVHGPREIQSRELDINRITVKVDEANMISGFSFN